MNLSELNFIKTYRGKTNTNAPLKIEIIEKSDAIVSFNLYSNLDLKLKNANARIDNIDKSFRIVKDDELSEKEKIFIDSIGNAAIQISQTGKITFHFLKPATAAVVIIQGVGIWNNYAQVVFYLTRSSMQTLPLSINSFFHKYGADWNLMAAASLISIIPTIVIFILFQKYFVKGIQAGALKG